MGTDDTADNRLLSLYRRYVGDPANEADVYAGFALFFGGIALGALGLLVFLWSAAVPAGEAFFWQLREIAIALAALGLPAFVLSVVVLLPVSRRAVGVAAIGSVVCLAAIGVFVAAYPDNWNVAGTTDYSAQGIAVYAGGLAVLVAATGSALVAHHIERTGGTAAGAGSEATGEGAGTASGPGTGAGTGSETVTDEQVQRDIEEAMSSTELTWGGVEKTETRQLRIETPDVDGSEVERSGLDEGSATMSRSEGVDDAVAGLRKLQGGEVEQATSSDVDEQTAALRELREQQRKEEAAEPDSIVERAKDWFGAE